MKTTIWFRTPCTPHTRTYTHTSKFAFKRTPHENAHIGKRTMTASLPNRIMSSLNTWQSLHSCFVRVTRPRHSAHLTILLPTHHTQQTARVRYPSLKGAWSLGSRLPPFWPPFFSSLTLVTHCGHFKLHWLGELSCVRGRTERLGLEQSADCSHRLPLCAVATATTRKGAILLLD